MEAEYKLKNRELHQVRHFMPVHGRTLITTNPVRPALLSREQKRAVQRKSR